MKFLALLWKFKGLIAFVFMIGVVLVVVAFVLNISKEMDASVVAPEVKPARMIKDKEPNNISRKAQKTGLALDLQDWVQIDGSLSSYDDRDRYRFDLAKDANGYEVQTWRESEEGIKAHTGVLGINGFPLTLIAFDSKNKVLTNRLKAAIGGGATLPEGTRRIEVVVSGQEPKENEPLYYGGGKKYRLYLRGRFKEPRKKDRGHSEAVKQP